MNTRKVATYYSDNDEGYAEVHMDFKEECARIEYHDNSGRLFFTEEFPNKSLHYVESAAENWALGIKKLSI